MAGWVIQPMETRLFLHGQGAGIGIFSSAFQEAESKPETDPGIVKVREGKSQEMLGTNMYQPYCRINAKSGGRFSALHRRGPGGTH
jgi:hypothetical protein